jgi:inorganic pyrophosphatase
VNKPWVQRLDELPSSWVDDLEHFFVSYNQAQGRDFVLDGRLGPDKAEQLLEKAIQSHGKRKNDKAGSLPG